MTIQMNDYVYFEDKQYVLIDCEKGKDPIDSAPFEVDDMQQLCTACYRGYMAEYFIEEDYIYGIKESLEIEKEDKKANLKSVKSAKHKLGYSGSLIIARDKDGSLGSADNTHSYLYYDEAYELYFEDGMILEVCDLKEALEEFQAFNDELERNKGVNDCKEPKDFTERFHKVHEAEREISSKYLKHEYGNYKWSMVPKRHS